MEPLPHPCRMHRRIAPLLFAVLIAIPAVAPAAAAGPVAPVVPTPTEVPTPSDAPTPTIEPLPTPTPSDVPTPTIEPLPSASPIDVPIPTVEPTAPPALDLVPATQQPVPEGAPSLQDRYIVLLRSGSDVKDARRQGPPARWHQGRSSVRQRDQGLLGQAGCGPEAGSAGRSGRRRRRTRRDRPADPDDPDRRVTGRWPAQ